MSGEGEPYDLTKDNENTDLDWLLDNDGDDDDDTNLPIHHNLIEHSLFNQALLQLHINHKAPLQAHIMAVKSMK